MQKKKTYQVGVKLINRFTLEARSKEEAANIIKDAKPKIVTDFPVPQEKDSVVSVDYIHEI